MGRSNLLFSREVHPKNYDMLLAQEPFLQTTTAYLLQVGPNFQGLQAGHGSNSPTVRVLADTRDHRPNLTKRARIHKAQQSPQNEFPGTIGPQCRVPAATRGIWTSKLKCQ